MNIVQLTQGTPEWQAFRAAHFTASEAPAMLGISPYRSRADLLREKCTGQTPAEDGETRKRFADGHRFEALARPLAETVIGEELYPVVCHDDADRLAASLDGATMDETVIWEHKTLNDDFRACRDCGAPIPEHIRAQVEHQLLVSGADRCLVTATRWNEDGTLAEPPFHGWLQSDPALRARILAGWQQFAADLKNWQPAAAAPEGKAPEQLPALHVQVQGQVVASNLAEFKAHALAVIGAINTELQTDNDFADAEKTVKWCKDVENRLAAAKESALGQTASIDELFRALDEIAETARRTRLDLEKKVKAKKDEIRLTKIREAERRFCDVVAVRTEQLGVALTIQHPDFAGAIRGLKTLASIDNALAAALTDATATVNRLFDDAQNNLLWLEESEARNLPTFPDLAQLLTKPAEDFRAIVSGRVAQHREAAERMRQEAEAKARAEEEARAAAAAAAEAQAQAQAAPEQAPAPVQQEAAAPETAPVAAPAQPEGEPVALKDINAAIDPLYVSQRDMEIFGLRALPQNGRTVRYPAGTLARLCDAIEHHVRAVRARKGGE